MRRRTVSGIAIGLYALAALVAAYTVWAVVHFYGYITEMIGQGQLIVSGSEFEIANFVMSNALQYGLYAVILFALGRVVQLNTPQPLGDLDDDFEDEDYDEADDGLEDEDDLEDEDVEEWLRSEDDKAVP
jgi:hypothetical protein